MSTETTTGHVVPAARNPSQSDRTPAVVVRRAVPRSALLALGGTLAGILNYVLSLALTHHLPPASYAAYSGAQGILLVNGVVGGAGVTWVVAQLIAQDAGEPSRRRAITFGTYANSLLGIVSGTVSGLLAASFAGSAAGLVVGASVTVLALGSTGLGIRQGEGRTATIGGIFFVEALVKVVVALGLVALTGLGVVGALLGGLAAAFVLLFAFLPYRRSIGTARLLAGTGSSWRSALRFTSLQAVVGVFAALDGIVAVALTDDPRQAGLYQAASALGRSLLFVASAVGVAVFPLLQGQDAHRHRTQALRTFGLVAVCAGVLLTTLPREVLLLVFPAGYAGLLRWLPWTAVLGVALGLQSLLLTFLQGARHTRRAGATTAACAVGVVSVVCGATLQWGVAGTATGSALSLALAAVVLSTLPQVRPSVLHALHGVTSPWFLLPTAAAVATLVLLRHHPWLWLPVAALYGLASCGTAFPEVHQLLSRFRPTSRARHRMPSGHLPPTTTTKDTR